MKLLTLRETYYEASGKVSDLVRQLSFAGIGLIWIFKYDDGDEVGLPTALLIPGFFIVLALVLDLLQYIYRTIAWAVYHWLKERAKFPEDEDFKAPARINYPTNTLFGLKILAIIIAYFFLLKYLAELFAGDSS